MDEVRATIVRFAAAMRGEQPFDEFADTEIDALQGVRAFPMRIKCATLAWHALDQALQRLA